MGITVAGGDSEMCAVCLLEFFVPLGLRGFFAVVPRGGAWRLAVFFVGAGASGSCEDRVTFSAVLVFLGTGVQWLNDFNSLSFIGSFASAFSPSLLDRVNCRRDEAIRFPLGCDDGCCDGRLIHHPRHPL